MKSLHVQNIRQHTKHLYHHWQVILSDLFYSILLFLSLQALLGNKRDLGALRLQHG